MALSDTAAPIPSRTEDSPIKVSGWLAVVGAVAGFGALAASSCCELPLALAGLGAGGAVFGGLEVLASWRPLLLGAAVVVVPAAWTLLFRRRSVGCNVDGSCSAYSPSKSARVLVSLGTVFVALQSLGIPTLNLSLSSLCDDICGDSINIDLSALQSPRVGNDANGCLPVLL
jgi:mercuric ion transport protein